MSIEVLEAVTFPSLREVLVRRRGPFGGMTVVCRIPRCSGPAALHEAMVESLGHSAWQPTSAVFPLAGETESAETGVKVEVTARYESTVDMSVRVPLTEQHREALTDEAVRFYTEIGEPAEGLEAYSRAAAGSVIWDARLLPIRFTGHRSRHGDLVRAHTVAETGIWVPAADRATDLGDHGLTARVLWQLILKLSH